MGIEEAGSLKVSDHPTQCTYKLLHATQIFVNTHEYPHTNIYLCTHRYTHVHLHTVGNYIILVNGPKPLRGNSSQKMVAGKHMKIVYIICNFRILYKQDDQIP